MATVLGVYLMMLLVFVAVAALGVAAVIEGHRRAQAAADLAALAAASALQGSAAPCPAARRVALRNGARLVDCRLAEDDSVTVTLRVTGPVLAGRAWPTRGTARAGPVGGSGDVAPVV